MSHLMGKPTLWFLNWSDTNRSVQSQKMTRMEFILDLERRGIVRIAKTKALISFAVCTQNAVFS